MNFKAIKEFFVGLPDDFDPTQIQNAAAKTEEQKAAELAATTAEAATAAAENKTAAAAAAPVAAPAVAVVEPKNEVANAAPEPSAREKELEAELATLRAGQVKRDAETFADTEIKEGRAFPAERETLISLFSQAAKDDSALQTKVSFTAGDKTEEVSRVDALKALYSVRKPHNLTKEELVSMGAGVLVTNSGDDTDYLAEAERQAKEYAARRNKAAQ